VLCGLSDKVCYLYLEAELELGLERQAHIAVSEKNAMGQAAGMPF